MRKGGRKEGRKAMASREQYQGSQSLAELKAKPKQHLLRNTPQKSFSSPTTASNVGRYLVTKRFNPPKAHAALQRASVFC